VPGLRQAVLARIGRGEAVLLDIRPFLLRTAAAAAAVLVVATAATLWQDARRGAGESVREAALGREDVLARIVRPRLGPER